MDVSAEGGRGNRSANLRLRCVEEDGPLRHSLHFIVHFENNFQLSVGGILLQHEDQHLQGVQM